MLRENRGIGFSFPDPQGISNCHSPIPRGMKIARELASLITQSRNLGSGHPKNYKGQDLEDRNFNPNVFITAGLPKMLICAEI